MKQFKIYTQDDQVLHEKAKALSFPLSEETKQTVKDMVEYLKASQDEETAKKYNIRPGVGIAAPQIGISERFFAIYFNDENGKRYEYGLVNPKIISSSVKKAYLTTGEGCLSVPKDVPGYVYRYQKITLKAYDVLTDREITLKLFGYPAIVFQHEYDHLDGILYYERINKDEPFKVEENAVAIS